MAKKTIHVIYQVDDKELIKADKAILKLGSDAYQTQQKVKKMGDEGEGAGKKITGSFLALKNVIAVLGLVTLAKQIFQVTAEFQKLEAVLTNSLGGKSAARAAMKTLQEFASKTPFSVKELTASYLKLVNQGFKPTVNQLRQLGDLSASVGKSFDQLTEAIIDAQTGEFERLKEFGIRAKKHGDEITFTFKGISQTVKFTTGAIQDYITSLGDLQGVSGSMAAISGTLEGKVSNLGDAFDSLFNNIGKLQDGPMAALIDKFIEGIQWIDKWIEMANMDALDFAEDRLKGFREDLEKANQALRNGDFTQANQSFIDLTNAINSANEELDELFKEDSGISRLSDDPKDAARIDQIWREIEVVRIEVQAYKEMREELKKNIGTAIEARDIKLDAAAKEAAAEQYLLDLMRSRIKSQQESLELGRRLYESIRSFRTNLDPEVQKVDPAAAERLKKIADELDAEAEMRKKADGKINEQRKKDQKQVLEELQKMKDDAVNEEYEKLKLAEERKRALLWATVDTLGAILKTMFDYRTADDSDREERYEKEIAAAGDNEKRREQVEKKFRAEREKAQKQEESKRKQAAIKQILVDTAINIVKSIANNGGIPLGLPFGALALALGVAQIGAVRKYAKGDIDIKGGQRGKDSIPALLMPGESIMTTDQTQKAKGILTEVRRGNLTDRTLKHAQGREAVGRAMDHRPIVEAIEKSKVDTVRIANDLFDVKKSREGGKTLVRRKHLTS